MRPRALISSKILAYMTGLCSRADSMAYRTGVASHVQFSGGFAKQNFPLRALFRVACSGGRSNGTGRAWRPRGR